MRMGKKMLGWAKLRSHSCGHGSAAGNASASGGVSASVSSDSSSGSKAGKKAWSWKLRFLRMQAWWRWTKMRIPGPFDIIWKIVYVFESVILVTLLSLFFLCCGCSL